MNQSIEFINPIDDENWNQDILSFPDYSFFHSSEWCKVLNTSYNYKPLYLVAKSGNDKSAIIPLLFVESFFSRKKISSLSFTDFCEPLLMERMNFEPLFAEIIIRAKLLKANSINFNGISSYLSERIPAYTFFEHNLDLVPDNEAIFSNFSTNHRRNIRKAEKQDLKCKIDNSKIGINEFIKLNVLTRKKHGLPPQPDYFFINLWNYVLRKDMGDIFLVSTKSNIIAGAVFLRIGEKVIYKYGASDESFQKMKPNNMLMWEAIKFYSNNSYKNFSFGKTELENEGLRKFKLSWGTNERNLNAYFFDVKNEQFIKSETKTTGMHNTIFKKMPLGLLKAIGNLTYKYIG